MFGVASKLQKSQVEVVPNYKLLTAFQQPNGMSGVTSYILAVTLGILREYAPELALLGCYYRILLTVTFQKNGDRYKVDLRPSLSGLQPGR
jgi:hypothetical protein